MFVHVLTSGCLAAGMHRQQLAHGEVSSGTQHKHRCSGQRRVDGATRCCILWLLRHHKVSENHSRIGLTFRFLGMSYLLWWLPLKKLLVFGPRHRLGSSASSYPACVTWSCDMHVATSVQRRSSETAEIFGTNTKSFLTGFHKIHHVRVTYRFGILLLKSGLPCGWLITRLVSYNCTTL